MKHLIVASLLMLLILCACGTQKSHQVSIAILTPITHPSLEQIEKGFIQTMEESSPGKYCFVTYNAQGNKTLMHSEIEEMIHQDHALIFTLGTTGSQMTTEIFSRKGIKTPIVFTCVNDPVGFHIVNSEHSPAGSVTGVKEMLNFQEELAALLKFKPNIQTLLLVYNPTEPGLQKDQKELEQILQPLGIHLITVEIFQANEMKAKVSPFIDRSDALIVLKDNTVVAGLDALIKLCNLHQIPLMASDLDSPDRGAAFGYGVHEIDFGIEGAKKALQILNEGVSPSQIPVTPVAEFSLRINPEAAIKQGISPSLIQEHL